jgi:chromosome segregation protein
MAGHEAARAALDQARAAETAASRRLDEGRRAAAGAETAEARARRDRDDAAAELAAVTELQAEAVQRVEHDRHREAELSARLPALEAAEAASRQRTGAMAEARRRLDAQESVAAEGRSELDTQRTALGERQALLRSRLAEVEDRLAGSMEAREQAESRRTELDATGVALERLVAFVHERLELLDDRASAMRERRRRETDAQRALSVELDGLRSERSAKERTLGELRERAQRAELEEAEVRLRLEQAIETCRTQLDIEPDAALRAEAPELPDGVTATVRVRELERDLRVMGPINPLALEEFDALSERHTFLTEQLDDVKASRRELNKVIRAIDEEVVRVFAAAFADVSENFEQLFATLFPGGQGRLKLTDPDDLLNTGVEVDAKPSGKNVRKLSLLSGGERSLTALAYLFSVFRSRPSPFYVMDEVEAALDDVNLHRFLDLLAEFRREAQLIIVSHQKRTMEAADCLYGVTMQPGGSSKVVSEKVVAGA